MSLPYSRGEAKERAREWKGACGVTLPSFSTDFQKLNETAIRHDIRLAHEMGFWGTLVASESGTTMEEYVRFMEIAADEAPKDFRLVAHLSFSTEEEWLLAADAASALGFEAGLLAYPTNFVPKTPKDVADWTKSFTEKTDLGMILFAVPTWGYRSFSPETFPHDALEEMARFDTSMAIKYEAGAPGIVTGLADVLRRCGEHVVVQAPMEYTAPALIEWYGVNWIGTSGYEAYGDRVPTWFKMLHEGRWEEGMKLFWSYQPAREARGAWSQSFGGSNLVHRVGWKYMSWLQGFSGGLLRMPQMRLSQGQMRMLRNGIEASGFSVPSDDSGFVLGRFPE